MNTNPVVPLIITVAIFTFAYFFLPFEAYWNWLLKAFFSSLPALLLGLFAYNLLPERMKD